MLFHNLCINEKVPLNASRLLGLGSKFCLESRLPNNDIIKTFSKLSRSICIKCFMECVSNEQPQGIGNPKVLDFNPKLYIKSKFLGCRFFRNFSFIFLENLKASKSAKKRLKKNCWTKTGNLDQCALAEMSPVFLIG